MKQERSRSARWRVAGLSILLAVSLVALVPLAIPAIDRADLIIGMVAVKFGDHEKAHGKFLPLAERGDKLGQYHLGLLYVRGKGVPRNYSEAAKWFRAAADQGLAEAQFNLAIMYGRGRGVRQDFVRAHMWLNLAAAQGLKRAIKTRDISEKKQLTHAQLGEARRQEREWRAAQERKLEQRRVLKEKSFYAAIVHTVRTRILSVVSPQKPARSLAGAWRSAPILGQLGQIQITVTFNPDGSFTKKDNFLSFRGTDPDIEYFWGISNGTYSVSGDKVTLDFDKIWMVQKKRSEDAVKRPPEPVRGQARRVIAHWPVEDLLFLSKNKDHPLKRIK